MTKWDLSQGRKDDHMISLSRCGKSIQQNPSSRTPG